jgi:photosystem II stability/assembly factor-like uncharacterized protein
MKKQFYLPILLLGLSLNIFAQKVGLDHLNAPNDGAAREAEKRPLYQVVQQCFDQLEIGPEKRYVNIYDSLSNLIGVQEEYYGLETNPQYRQIQEWFEYLEPRLYPTGQFVDASKIMMNEIKRLQKNNHNSEKQLLCNPAAQWQNIGPFIRNTNDSNNNTDAAISTSQHQSLIPGIGRVNFIKKHPTPTNNTLYIGASNGGLWKSTDNGATWQVLNDKIAVLGTSDLVFDPSNPDIMYLATGDKSRGGNEAIGTTAYTVGVLKSIDGGNTWDDLAPIVKWSMFNSPIGQSVYLKINRLIITPSGNLLIGTSDSPTTSSSSIESGIWQWDNSASTWDQKLQTTNSGIGSSISDMLQLPSGKIIAATQHGKLYSSTDNGNTFALIASPEIPATNVGRVALAKCPSNTTAFYALFVGENSTFNKLIKSADEGATFQTIGFTSGVSPLNFFTGGNEHLGLTVSPTDENIVFLASNKEIFKLTVTGSGVLNADATAKSISQRPGSLVNEDYVHPDVKGFEWVGNTLFVATDGGVAQTTDGGNNWSNWYELTGNLAISECYRIGVAPENANVIFTGTHDNGIWRWDKNGNNSKWKNIREGDCSEIAPISANEVYADYFASQIPSTNITSRIFKIKSSFGDTWQYISNNIQPSWTTTLRNGTNSILLKNPNYLYTSANHLYRGTIGANNVGWTNSTGNYYNTTNPPPVGVMGINHETSAISAMAISPYDNTTLYISKRRPNQGDPAAPKDPLVYRSDDQGTTWIPVYDNPTTIYNTTTTFIPTQKLPQLHLNRLAVHPNDSDHLWAVFSGYQADKKVYDSQDGGATWRNITGGGLPNLPVNAIAAYEKDELLHLVVGTDAGVYYTNQTFTDCAGGVQWKYFGQGAIAGQDFPNVIVQELDVHGTGNDRVLRAATFGRGVWETPLPTVSDCICSTCGEEGYPLQANFNTFPQDAVNDPLFEPLTNWSQWLAPLNPVLVQDASIGIIDPTSYQWTFSTAPSQVSNCDGSTFNNQSCASAIWGGAGTYDVTLTVSDIFGCTASTTQSITINAYDPSCNLPTLELTPTNPIVTCDISLSTFCPTANENGSIIITPISTQFGSGAYSYEIEKDGNNIATDIDLILQENGQLKLDCLGAGVYSVTLWDNMTLCSTTATVTLATPTTQGQLIVGYTTQSTSYSCNGKITIGKINNATFDPAQYTFAWSDCPTCTTPLRTGLCSGLYTVTVTDLITGCQAVQSIYVQPVCAPYNGGSTVGGVIATIDVYPTVFDDVANLKINLNYDAEVSVDVYDLYGTFVKKLMNQEIKEAGEYYLQDDASAVTDGVYVYIVRACAETKGDIGIKH